MRLEMCGEYCEGFVKVSADELLHICKNLVLEHNFQFSADELVPTRFYISLKIFTHT